VLCSTVTDLNLRVGSIGAERVENTTTWYHWLPVLAGLLLLYLPTFYDLAGSHWQRDDAGHGPVILAVVGWLIWQRRQALLTGAPAPIAGFGFLLAGLCCYVLGRSHSISLLEVAALPLNLAGVILAMSGWTAMRELRFAIFFTVFLVPLPGLLIDALTAPLKEAASDAAERLLYAAGYPVARTGVVLTIGRYQLLVADACSGLQSMMSLSALGLLYVYLVRRPSLLHNLIVLASILPVAFLANIVRVVLLMLVTYHLGDDAAQGFLHFGTGILLLLVALICLIGLDGLLAWAFKRRRLPRWHA
jgi:exosortase B